MIYQMTKSLKSDSYLLIIKWQDHLYQIAADLPHDKINLGQITSDQIATYSLLMSVRYYCMSTSYNMLLFSAARSSPESGQDEEQASAPPAEIASGEDGSSDSANRSISGPDDSLSGQETAVAVIKSELIFGEENVKTKVGKKIIKFKKGVY